MPRRRKPSATRASRIRKAGTTTGINGKYGWALPQAYLQFNKGDLDIKVGHFFTPLGYEVIPATGNFFYSHSYTMFNSEPFTHTGVLSTYKASDTMYRTTLAGRWAGIPATTNSATATTSSAVSPSQLNDCVKYTLPVHGRRPRLARRRLLAQQRGRRHAEQQLAIRFPKRPARRGRQRATLATH